MTRSIILCCVLAWLPDTADAADFTTASRITPQMLVVALRTPPGARHSQDRTASQWSDFDQARGYLRAARDALQTWCPPAGLSALDIDGEVVAFLARLPPSLAHEAAFAHVSKALSSKFPCLDPPAMKQRRQ